MNAIELDTVEPGTEKPVLDVRKSVITPVRKVKNNKAESRNRLISQFRDILSRGEYTVKADEIASKMVQKIRDDKNQAIF